MGEHSSSSKYQCIECGAAVESLYRDYKAGIIKISHCEKCGSVADKYIEYDSVIILLDTLLLRLQAFRHLLFNVKFKSRWKSVLLLWVCDSFTKMIQRRTNINSRVSLSILTHDFVGMELYVNYLAAACEILCFMSSVFIILALKSLFYNWNFRTLYPGMIVKAIVVGNLGRIFAIPALLWGQSYSPAFVWLCQGFVCLSSVQALRVGISGHGKNVFALLSVVVGTIAQFTIPTLIASSLSSYLL